MRDVFFRNYFTAFFVLFNGMCDALGDSYGGIALLPNDFIASHNSCVDTMAITLPTAIISDVGTS